ncbi:unnamed protein product, partial [marine sediment metagenome]
MQENKYYDFYLYVDQDSQCNNLVENITSSGGRPMEYYNYSANIQDKTLSELILCNADNSNVTNVTISGSDTLNNNAFLIRRSDSLIVSGINSSNNSDGIDIVESSFSIFENITANSNDYGFYYTYSNYSTIANIEANSNIIFGLRLIDSNYNSIRNITSNNNEYSLYITDSNSSNI